MSKKVIYNNFTLNVPERYFHDNLTDRFKKNIYEKEETLLCKKYFNKKDKVLELGSCLGYISCILSKNVNSIISVEANPELKECLIQTKKDNNLNNVQFINAYIDKEYKVINFQTYDNIVAGSGDREDLEINNTRGWGNTLRYYKINTIRLEDIENINLINSLVIDIEGGELLFLINYKNYIIKNIKKICIELHGHLMKDNNFDNKCIKLLISMGFNMVDRIGISYYFEKK